MERLSKQNLRITILGANNCGKTAVTVRFLTGKFIFEYESGHDIVYQHDFFIASTKVPLEIVDTSRNEDLADAIYGSDGLVIVYAIDNGTSFEKAKEIMSDISDINVKLLRTTALVGNKSDLWPYKTVEQDDGKTLADKYQCKYFEISALSCKEGVSEMFDVVVNLAAENMKRRSYSLPENRFRKVHEEFDTRRSSSVQLTKRDLGFKTKTFLKTVSKAALGVRQNEKHNKSFKTFNHIIESTADIMHKSLGDTEDSHMSSKRNNNNHSGKDKPLLHKTICSMNFAFSAIAMPMDSNNITEVIT